MIYFIERLLNALTHSLKPCKMDDAVNAALAKDIIQGLFITDIHIEEKRPFACNLLYAVKGFFVAVDKVVHNNDIKSCVDQLNACVRTDESGSAGDKNHMNLSIK